EAVQQRRFTRAGTAGNQHIAANATDDLQNLGTFRRNGTETHELVERQLVALELTNGQDRAVEGQWLNDGVDTRPVGKTRVADRRRFVDAAADLADDALTDIQQLLIVAESNAGSLNLAVDFDVDGIRAIDHDVRDIVARQQWFERTI